MRLSALLAAPVAALLACTAASGPASAAHAKRPVDWPVYHYNGYRSANYPSMPTPHHVGVAKSVSLDGQVYASPIVHNGRTLVATENNTVYRLGPHFHVVWKRHLASPSPAGQRPCGDIDPLGITGTPAYSKKTGKVYVAAELSGSPPTHRLYALNFKTGKVSWSRSLDLPGVDRVAMQERGALAIIGSRVYVPFGGLAGDCGQYKGRVVGYALSGKGRAISYTVPTAREAGIWTPPGPVSDRAGHILVAVGNGAAGRGDRYDYSDSILELSQTLKRTDSFSPASWASDNQSDLDLGSQGPAIVGRWIFSAGKSGAAYVLRRTHLGGIGGQVRSRSLCRSFGGTAVHNHVVFVPCVDGLRAVRIGAKGVMHVLWHAAGNITGSPVLGGGRVWSLDPNGRLYELGMSTGKVYASVAVGQTSRFATPSIYGRNLYVPTLRGVVKVHTS